MNLNKILYIYYEKWAINQAYTFKKLHNFKCRQIKIDELQIYSLKGLIDGIKNYNGKSNFLEYIKIYIEGCLFSIIEFINFGITAEYSESHL